MTFQKAQESGFLLSENSVKKIATDVYRQYRIAEKTILEELAKLYGKMSSLAPEDYYNFAIQLDRLKKLLEEVRRQYTFYSKKAGGLIAKSGEVAFTENYYRQQYVLTYFSPRVDVDLSFTLLNDDLVNYAVTGLPEHWKKIPKKFDRKLYTPKYGTLSEILVNNRVNEINKVSTAITQQLILGKSFPNTASRLKGVFGDSRYNALRVIRTESTRLLNQGAFTNSINAIEQGLDITKQWLATLDIRTRNTHGALDGKEADVKGYFKIGSDRALYPGDFSLAKNNIHCRCSYIDKIKELPITVRRGKDPITNKNKVFSWRNYNTWLNSNIQS